MNHRIDVYLKNEKHAMKRIKALALPYCAINYDAFENALLEELQKLETYYPDLSAQMMASVYDSELHNRTITQEEINALRTHKNRLQSTNVEFMSRHTTMQKISREMLESIRAKKVKNLIF
jgi:hypothetical protein